MSDEPPPPPPPHPRPPQPQKRSSSPADVAEPIVKRQRLNSPAVSSPLRKPPINASDAETIKASAKAVENKVPAAGLPPASQLNPLDFSSSLAGYDPRRQSLPASILRRREDERRTSTNGRRVSFAPRNYVRVFPGKSPEPSESEDAASSNGAAAAARSPSSPTQTAFSLPRKLGFQNLPAISASETSFGRNLFDEASDSDENDELPLPDGRQSPGTYSKTNTVAGSSETADLTARFVKTRSWLQDPRNTSSSEEKEPPSLFSMIDHGNQNTTVTVVHSSLDEIENGNCEGQETTSASASFSFPPFSSSSTTTLPLNRKALPSTPPTNSHTVPPSENRTEEAPSPVTQPIEQHKMQINELLVGSGSEIFLDMAEITTTVPEKRNASSPLSANYKSPRRSGGAIRSNGTSETGVYENMMGPNSLEEEELTPTAMQRMFLPNSPSPNQVVILEQNGKSPEICGTKNKVPLSPLNALENHEISTAGSPSSRPGYGKFALNELDSSISRTTKQSSPPPLHSIVSASATIPASAPSATTATATTATTAPSAATAPSATTAPSASSAPSAAALAETAEVTLKPTGLARTTTVIVTSIPINNPRSKTLDLPQNIENATSPSRPEKTNPIVDSSKQLALKAWSADTSTNVAIITTPPGLVNPSTKINLTPLGKIKSAAKSASSNTPLSVKVNRILRATSTSPVQKSESNANTNFVSGPSSSAESPTALTFASMTEVENIAMLSIPQVDFDPDDITTSNMNLIAGNNSARATHVSVHEAAREMAHPQDLMAAVTEKSNVNDDHFLHAETHPSAWSSRVQSILHTKIDGPKPVKSVEELMATLKIDFFDDEGATTNWTLNRLEPGCPDIVALVAYLPELQHSHQVCREMLEYRKKLNWNLEELLKGTAAQKFLDQYNSTRSNERVHAFLVDQIRNYADYFRTNSRVAFAVWWKNQLKHLEQSLAQNLEAAQHDDRVVGHALTELGSKQTLLQDFVEQQEDRLVVQRRHQKEETEALQRELYTEQQRLDAMEAGVREHTGENEALLAALRASREETSVLEREINRIRRNLKDTEERSKDLTFYTIDDYAAMKRDSERFALFTGWQVRRDLSAEYQTGGSVRYKDYLPLLYRDTLRVYVQTSPCEEPALAGGENGATGAGASRPRRKQPLLRLLEASPDASQRLRDLASELGKRAVAAAGNASGDSDLASTLHWVTLRWDWFVVADMQLRKLEQRFWVTVERTGRNEMENGIGPRGGAIVATVKLFEAKRYRVNFLIELDLWRRGEHRFFDFPWQCVAIRGSAPKEEIEAVIRDTREQSDLVRVCEDVERAVQRLNP